MPNKTNISPVLILSTGRCGSTMVSKMLDLHPRVLSLSEFFIPLGSDAFTRKQPDGNWMWKVFSRQSLPLHAMLKRGDVVSESLYPFGEEGARFQPENIPPILAVTLPHLTDDFENLYDELEVEVSSRPRMPLADQYRSLFESLATRFGNDVWVERSGGSLMLTAKLLHHFPEARVIHVYRDGRDTAMSMSHHHNFKVLIGAMLKARRMGVDVFRDFEATTASPVKSWVQNQLFRFVNPDKLAEEPVLADFGDYWSRSILFGRKMMRDLPVERLLEVKFEDMQQSPEQEVRRLIRFIDPSLEEESWIKEVAAIPGPARSKFSSLAESEQEALQKACAPGLKVLGYTS
ncbi:MAG: sulfotransferase [Verrucomicrobiota bacterium]